MSGTICRACLDPGGKGFIPMNGMWKQKYACCIGVKAYSKYIPLMLCKKCASIIDSFYKFKRLCLANDEVWRASISNIQENKPLLVEREKNNVDFPKVIKTDKKYTEENVIKREFINVEKLGNKEDRERNKEENVNELEIRTEKVIKLDSKNKNVLSHIKSCNKNSNKNDNNYVNITDHTYDHNYAFVNKSDKNYTNVNKIEKNYDSSMMDDENMENDTDNAELLPEELLPVKVEVNHDDDDTPVQSTSSEKPRKELKHVLKKHNKPIIYEKSKFSDLLKSLVVYPCGLCKFECPRSSDLAVHLQDHVNDTSLTCQLCEYHGRDFADMIVHRSTHVPSLERRYGLCLFCNVPCKDSLAAGFHYRQVHLKKERGGWCETCGKQYRKLDVFRVHLNMHNDMWKYQCDHCGIKYYQRSQIVVHMKSHTLHGSYMCDVCGKGLRTAFSLKQHQNIHFDRKPMKCEHCNKIFKGNARLQNHLKEIQREKKFTCIHCGKRYLTQYRLDIHSICHTDSRPLQCDICHKTFKGKSNHRYHMSTVHKWVKDRFECKVCGKKYRTEEPLVEHYHDVHKISDSEIERMQGIVAI